MPMLSTTQRWVLGLTSVASIMVALDLLVVSTALPTIQADLDTSLAQVQWAVTGYGLAFAVLLAAGAALGDRFGRRRVFVVGLTIFAVASASCAAASDIGWLISSRVLQGAGAAFVMPLAVAMLSAHVTDDVRGRALGLFEGLTGVATMAGPVVGGSVAHLVGWQWVFWVNVPIALTLIPLVFAKIDESHGERARLDVPGMALVTASALGIVWGLVRGNVVGWSSPEVLLPLGFGVLLIPVAVAWQRRASAPMIPPRLFRNRTFSASAVVSVLLYAALYGTVFFLAQYLQIGLGYSALAAGWCLVPWTATLLVVAPLAGALADRIGERPVLVTGLALKAMGLGWLAVIASPETSYPAVLVALLVEGIGTSMAIPVVQSAMLGAVCADDIGKASGVNGMSQELGGVLGVAVLVALFTSVGDYGSAVGFSAGFGAAMTAAAVFSAVAALVGFAVAKRSGAEDHSGDFSMKSESS